jgi:hypothetical protein
MTLGKNEIHKNHFSYEICLCACFPLPSSAVYSNGAIIKHILHSLKLIIVTTNNFIAAAITKNTWKNLMVLTMIVTIIIKTHGENKHCHSDKFFPIFFVTAAIKLFVSTMNNFYMCTVLQIVSGEVKGFSGK